MSNEQVDLRLESFERAFTDCVSGCVRTCRCGQEFFDDHNHWDWNDGELERLRADPKAIAVGYAVGTLTFEGNEYVLDCDCWKKRARVIIGFIDGHGHQLVKYLNLEKKRKQAIADAAPSMEE